MRRTNIEIVASVNWSSSSSIVVVLFRRFQFTMSRFFNTKYVFMHPIAVFPFVVVVLNVQAATFIIIL